MKGDRYMSIIVKSNSTEPLLALWVRQIPPSDLRYDPEATALQIPDDLPMPQWLLDGVTGQASMHSRRLLTCMPTYFRTLCVFVCCKCTQVLTVESRGRHTAIWSAVGTQTTKRRVFTISRWTWARAPSRVSSGSVFKVRTRTHIHAHAYMSAYTQRHITAHMYERIRLWRTNMYAHTVQDHP